MTIDELRVRVPVALLALALGATACGDDSGGDGAGGRGDGTGGGDGNGGSFASTFPLGTGVTDGTATGAAIDCPGFQPGTDMLSTDWGVGEGNRPFSAYAQAVGDVEVATRALVGDVTAGCFDLAAALGAAPPAPGEPPALADASAACEAALAALETWEQTHTPSIEVERPTCEPAAVDSACVAGCAGDADCLEYCDASAAAAPLCTEPSARVELTSGDEEPAVLEAIGAALERLLAPEARLELLLDALQIAADFPQGPPVCISLAGASIDRSADDLQGAAELDVEVISATGI